MLFLLFACYNNTQFLFIQKAKKNPPGLSGKAFYKYCCN